MKKVLAISGGVDSMLLLHFFAHDKDAVVAHFDHGTRPSSAEDAEFVKKAAERYGLPFFLGHGVLGENISEADARAARYKFLKNAAQKVNGEIYTAHHLDDLVESIAINLARGTGWRGLTPFYDKNIKRVFLEDGIDKKEILRKAAELKIIFRQDPTNTEDNYLRNRIRQNLSQKTKNDIQDFYNLYKKQCALRKEIEKLILEILPADGRYERKWFDGMDENIAIEILRAGLMKMDVSATRVQIKNLLKAILEYAPEKKFNLPGGKMVTIHKHNFVLK
ncbi:tRNA lysidine(34) synthetase TilS [Candidatus Saccharibacteria bacterium]|nr:tRNA lysidine(34) synthetase TilS [Candidatus Saccharibacteria bacterium]